MFEGKIWFQEILQNSDEKKQVVYLEEQKAV